ncbi:type II toxin-antitoxin system prevent-host-death family antitoxin [Porticoccus sp. W117]|uniref:type II toxin-antitoxin system Phd/YefM family antitoxin n=1 Tax=Porticoccus sp. W117 TaxID=3054777 RepID=UPI0025977FC1|nr:type II toxin-antitoxin system prevent-host-death family antitoxin [Porticoccus sp. W117]MDM3870240.1 type II toxin-antitoxin system prevent-host-death family antitoxin [Porticoccus sp. W117]
MLEEIGSYDAKTKLAEILRRVELGESFTITKRGRPVADVVPSQSGKRSSVKTAVENILSAKKHPVSDEYLDELKKEGRK